LVRTFVELPDVSLKAVVDRDTARLEHIARRYPAIPVLTRELDELFAMDLDAVVVSTPPETHYPVVQACLEHGLDVFVEKPLATEIGHAEQLIGAAARRGQILMVGHIGAYNPAVLALKEMIEGGELGAVAYVDAARGGLGLFHPSLNVIWDLAPHDIAILVHILGDVPVGVSARAAACVEASVEDVAFVALRFSSGVLAHVRLSWLDPCKTRRITVVGRQKMVVYDDLESQEKLKVYDKRVDAIRRTDTFGESHFAYHYGSVVSPYIIHDEPLRVECAHFVDCVLRRTRPLTDGENGLAVVQVIQAAQQSLHNGGVEIAIPHARGLQLFPAPDAIDPVETVADPVLAGVEHDASVLEV
jgi:predicted dehydrogenase